MKPSDKILRQLGVSFIHEQHGVSEYRLDCNGLKIVLHPVESARAVAIVQHVHVGSRHEGAGNTGHSHLLEHMLFKGSPTFNTAKGNSYDQFMKRMGGRYNATTWYDRTNYYGVVPAASMRQYLAYEADRLRNAYLTDEDLRTEMPVVVDEFDRGDNDEDQLLERQLMATAYTEHQYRMDTIGNRAEVMSVTAAALRERLYDVYYYPNNCTVIASGCFQVEQALRDIVALYADIAPSPRRIPMPKAVEPPQFGERRFVINRPGDLPRVLMGFHVPEADHQHTPALTALNIILGGSESSRLYRKLVDQGLASEVHCDNHPLHDPGLFKVYAKLTPGTNIGKVERIILKELERIANSGVTNKELQRAKVFNRNGSALMRTDRLDYALAISEHEAAADWRWGIDWDDHFDAVTLADVDEVARLYLQADNRTVGHFVPKKTSAASSATQKESHDEAATDHTEQDTAATADVPQSACCDAGPANDLATATRVVVLPNGMTLQLVHKSAEDAAVGVSLRLPAGHRNSPAQKVAVCDLTAEMLGEGSQKYSKDQIAELVAEMRVQFEFYTNAFDTSHQTLVPERELVRYIDLLADVLRNPLFNVEEFDLLKARQAAGYEEDTNSPKDRAVVALTQSIYQPGSPFRETGASELLQQLKTINVDDLKAFHKRFYTPKGTYLSLVGNFDIEATVKLLTDAFGAWTGDEPPAVETNALPATKKARMNVEIEGKENLTILVGLPVSVKESAEDFLAARLANAALGGDTLASRLGLEIREKRGLTYGVTSSFVDTTYGGGLWLIEMTTNNGKLPEALPLIQQVVEGYIKDGITEAELAAERESLIMAFSLAQDNPLSVARVLTRSAVAGTSLAMLDAFTKRVAAVTKAEVDAAIRKHFRIAEAVTVVAGQLQTAD